MQTLSIGEIKQVSGGGFAEVMGTIGLTSGGAVLGGYYGAMRFGATLGSAAGPLGAFAGALTGGACAYLYYRTYAK